MASRRQDSWSQGDDMLLAQVVLDHIKKGSTQLKAFEETGKILKRTASACGFRWNAFVRKQYKEAIASAKKEWNEIKKKIEQTESSLNSSNETEVSDNQHNSVKGSKINLELVIDFILKIEQEKQELENKYDSLNRRFESQTHQLNQLQKEHHSIMAILGKASKLTGKR